MAQDYKVLAQAALSSSTDTDLYTAPAATQVVVSTIVVANRSSSATGLYRIAVIPSGETLTDKHYVAYDVLMPISESTTLTFGLTLGAGDKVVARASTSDFSFNVFGVEFS